MPERHRGIVWGGGRTVQQITVKFNEVVSFQEQQRPENTEFSQDY